jgi:hypothetical protein
MDCGEALRRLRSVTIADRQIAAHDALSEHVRAVVRRIA